MDQSEEMKAIDAERAAVSSRQPIYWSVGLWGPLGIALAFALWVACCKGARDQKPAEWAGWFSAFAATLGFLWFVLSHLQQADAIRLNTLELRMQHREMMASVEEQRNAVAEHRSMVEAARQQAEAAVTAANLARVQAETGSIAHFVVSKINATGTVRDITFQNHGGPAEVIRIDLPPNLTARFEPSPFVNRGATSRLVLKTSGDHLPMAAFGIVEIAIHYRTELRTEVVMPLVFDTENDSLREV